MMRKSTLRHFNILKRKNFLPTLIATLLLWLAAAGLVYFVEPETPFAIPLFFVLIFLSLLFTFSIAFANSRRGFLTALGLTFFLVLRYFGIGNILNFVLILAFLTSVEIYFNRTN